MSRVCVCLRVSVVVCCLVSCDGWLLRVPVCMLVCVCVCVCVCAWCFLVYNVIPIYTFLYFVILSKIDVIPCYTSKNLVIPCYTSQNLVMPLYTLVYLVIPFVCVFVFVLWRVCVVWLCVV